MQLSNTKVSNKFNIYFNERETNNVRAILNSAISCSNRKLCYCIEEILPKRFEQFKNRRPMIMNIYNGYNYIETTVEAQNIDIDFKKPTDNLFKVTQVIFSDKKAFEKWKSTNHYTYKVANLDRNNVLVTIFNLSIEDEFSLALNENANIILARNIVEYFFNKTIDKVKECFQN